MESAVSLRRPRFTLTAAISCAAVIGAGNVLELVSRSAFGRVRDLRVLRLLARYCDLAGVNLQAILPRFAHHEMHAASVSGSAALLAIAAVIAFAVLLPIAILATMIASRLGPSHGPALVVTVMVIATIALAGGSPMRPAVTAIAIVCIGSIFYALAFRHGAVFDLVFTRTAFATIVIVSGCSTAIAIAGARHVVVRPPPPRGAPNIILISVDSLRADHLHVYGYNRCTSPNLDRLAKQGALFETVMAPTSWTLPSHMTLMTALPPERHGVISNRKRLAAGIDTLPQRLQREGYYTGGIVSATYLDGMFGFDRGFDEYDDYSLLHAAGGYSANQVSSPQVTNLALQFLDRRAAATDGRPFFLFLHMFDVHYDYNPPEPFAHMFDPVYEGKATGRVGAMTEIRKRRDLDHVIALYDGEIAFVDAHIGNILRAVSALHLDDDTIVAVVADHGEEFFEHGGSGHFRTLYDEVLHVPLIIRYPGHIPAGKRVTGQARLMDVPSTLIELAGLRVSKPASDDDAVSLGQSLFAGAPRSLPAYGDLNATLASLRTDREKVIWNLRTNKREFYDLVHDPGEHHAVRADDEMNGLAMRLEQWRSSATEKDPADKIDLDDEEKSALRALGYLN